MPITYGRVPRPDITMKIIPRSPRGSGGSGNQAWDNLGPRRLVGTCVHRMEGNLNGTDGYFRADGRTKALTDYGIGGALDGSLDGVIYQWIEDGAAVAPWANGSADDLEGDGPAFVQTYGVNAVNRDLKSIELSGYAATPVTPKQLESLAKLIAYIHDQAKVPWDRFPVHPASGVSTQMQHWEFSSKDCPFKVVRDLTDTYHEMARQIMKQYQTDDVVVPTKPKPTEPPDFPYAELFGTLVPYDPNGPVSKFWKARGDLTGEYPPLVRIIEQGGTRYYQFGNGMTLRYSSGSLEEIGTIEAAKTKGPTDERHD